jgi:hypothetical protein
MRRFIILFALACLLIPAAAVAQTDGQLEMLRSDIANERVSIFTQVLALSDAESEAFWPVYREYELELAKVTDKRVALIKEFAGVYESMDNTIATDLLKRSFDIADDRTKVQKSYMKKFSKVLPATTVARFFQTERFITSIIDLQVAWELPLVETVYDATKDDKSGSMGTK